jgi:hypothetical protein
MQASRITFHVSALTPHRTMNTNVFSNTAPPEGVSAEPRGLIAVLIALLLALRNYLKRKLTPQPELLSRAEFCLEMRDLSDRMHADHLALLEKLAANHRELLAALEHQGTRISALEADFARLDERTTK